MNDVFLKQNTSIVKAVEVRRKLEVLPEIASVLSVAEKKIFEASTKTLICEMDDVTLIDYSRKLFRYIAAEIGYTIPDAVEWAFIQSRLFNVLKTYHSQMSLTDIRLAFELTSVGELDNYFPKDNNGNPDKKHYNRFTAEYLTRVINAYKARQSEVMAKVYKYMPEQKKTVSEQEKAYYSEFVNDRIKTIYLTYKYTGRLVTEYADETFLYNWLRNNGLAEMVTSTEEDRNKAYYRFLAKAAKNMVNKYEAAHVRKVGKEASSLDYLAFDEARKTEIKRAFDRMIKSEFQLYF